MTDDNSNDRDLPNPRREFLKSIGLGFVAASAVGGATIAAPDDAEAMSSTDVVGRGRVAQAARVRARATAMAGRMRVPRHRNNGEERDYPYVGTYTKGLPKDFTGGTEQRFYEPLRKALRTGKPSDFEAITVGGKRLKNPLLGLSFDLQGGDVFNYSTPLVPRIDSAEGAAEIVEVYWQALLRDTNFEEYSSDPLANAALADMGSRSGYRGPALQDVTDLFTTSIAGVDVGPHISQFLYKDIPSGSLTFSQRQQTAVPSVDFLAEVALWLHRQNGRLDGNVDQYDSTLRYIRNGRDLATFVHYDKLSPIFTNAALYLIAHEYAYDSGNPYTLSQTMDPFGTFGYPHVLACVAEVSQRALKACWFQKWWVHRRARPEEVGGQLHFHLTGDKESPIHTDALTSDAMPRIFAQNQARNANMIGTYLLPQAYPEGCPLHPAYPSGHAAVAGACATVLKAFFEESSQFVSPVVTNSDGTGLLAYSGPDASQLTVGGELNKLAWNIGMGRCWAGIHWRSDIEAGLRLGEKVAIQILKEQNITYRERNSFTLTTFDGDTITIRNR